MQKIQFFMYDITYKAKSDKSYIYLFGRSARGKRIIVVDDSFQPYFLVKENLNVSREKTIEKLKELKEEGEKKVTKIVAIKKKEAGKGVELLKVYVTTPKNVPKIARQARELNEVDQILEFDISFVKKYIIDRAITPLTLLEADV